jgi:hypothetical protein
MSGRRVEQSVRVHQGSIAVVPSTAPGGHPRGGPERQ